MHAPSSEKPDEILRYGLTAQALHWLTFFGVAGAFALGLIMVDMSFSPLQLKMYAWHKWLGVCIWALVLLRVLWRWRHPPPPLPAATPLWQQRAAHVTHALLYGLLLLIPFTGWLMSSAMGFTTVLFGVLPLPDALSASEVAGEWLAVVHYWLNKTLLGLVMLHVAAALKHQLVDHDGLMQRMLPKRVSS